MTCIRSKYELSKAMWKTRSRSTITILYFCRTTYFGTSTNNLSSILTNRSIPFDGDQLKDGTTFASGHPNPKVCTTSPSLAYASQTKFAKQSRFTPSDRLQYNVQVVLLCKQKADTVTVNGEEWTTKARAALMFFGLLVRLQKLR